MLVTNDSYEYLKTLQDHSNDIIYCDPPYALGSEVIVRKDGKVDYKKANDFMNKWDMPTGSYWEKWFDEAYRTLKHGGWLIMFGMDRQLLLFKYYAHLSGFEEQQSLYWYFISNFPKATDLSKMIDKSLGEEREVLRVRENDVRPNMEINSKKESNPYQLGLKADGSGVDTKPSSDLAKKYDGYKYSISPLKQTNETIMVFKKPTKTGSPLHDCLAYEKGDKTITVSALNIDGNRVGVEVREQFSGKGTNGDVFNEYPQDNAHWETVTGRYPAQTFIDSQVAEVLDRQSGVSKGSSSDYDFGFGNQDNPSHNITNIKSGIHFDDIGGCSKILHKCDYTQEDYDLYNYEPKVNGHERNAGCDELNEKPSASSEFRPNHTEKALNGENRNPYGRWKPLTNNHPTLKPIALNEKILKLFKTPNDQVICYPFAGAGSEIIGGIKAGFENWHGCEINQEYVDIANARIEYWKKEMFTQTSIFDFL